MIVNAKRKVGLTGVISVHRLVGSHIKHGREFVHLAMGGPHASLVIRRMLKNRMLSELNIRDVPKILVVSHFVVISLKISLFFQRLCQTGVIGRLVVKAVVNLVSRKDRGIV